MAVVDQRAVALELANQVRMKRARERAHVRMMSRAESCAVVADVLSEVPDWAASMRVFELLLWARTAPGRRIGQSQVRMMMVQAHIANGLRRLRELSPRQREVLAAELRAFAERSERR